MEKIRHQLSSLLNTYSLIAVLRSCAIVAIAYLVLGIICLNLGDIDGYVASFWLPSGLVTAVILKLGYSILPGIFISATIIDALFSPSYLWRHLAIGVSQCLEGIVTYYIFTNIIKEKDPFYSLKNFLWFLVAIICGDFVHTLIGAIAVPLIEGITPDLKAINWFMGGFGGNIILAPFLLTWWGGKWRNKLREIIRVQYLLLASLIFIAIYIINIDLIPFLSFRPAIVIIPLLLWGAFSFSPSGSTLINFIMAILMTWMPRKEITQLSTALGDSQSEDVILLQLLGLTILLTTLIVLVINTEKQRFQIQLERVVNQQAIALDEAKQELQRLGETALQLTENIPVGTYVFRIGINQQPEFTFVSDRYLTMLKLQREQILKDATIPFSLIHPEEYEAFMALNQKTFQNGTSFFWEGRMIVNGETRWYRLESIPRISVEGEKIWEGVLTDITERVENQRQLTQMNLELEARVNQRTIELQESQDFLQRITDASPSILFVYDVEEQRNIYVNREIGLILGYTPEEIQGMGNNFFPSLMHPDDLQKVGEEYTHIYNIKDGEIREWEYRMKNKEGKWRWLYSRYTPFTRNAEGLVKRTIGSAQDITERKEAELENQKLKERLQFILAVNPAVIFTCKAQNFHLTFISDNVRNVMGYTPEEILATPDFWINHLHPEDASTVLAEMNHLMEKGYCNHEYRSLHRDGNYRWVRNELRLIRDSQGNPLEIVGYFTDVGDRKEAETQLQQRNQELIHATRLKDEFLAMMSHELRTPLNAILGVNECLQEEIYGAINDRQLKALNTIENSAYHLLDLINDVLDVSKIEAGEMKLNTDTVSIRDLCHSSMMFIQPQAQKKNITLKSSFCASLPTITIDERRIRQALINLLNNAVKFTPEGGSITLEIDYPLMKEKETPPFIRLAVMDTGIGIAPENIKKLFQPFVQIDSALNRNYEGTGLGLTLVKRIVELHGGTVEVSSELGKGSCFTIDLPCQM